MRILFLPKISLSQKDIKVKWRDSKIPANKVCKNSNNKSRKKSKKNGYDLAVIATKKIKKRLSD